MKIRFTLVATFFVLALTGCVTEPEYPEVAQLKWITKADPVADARRALAAGDLRLIAVYGVTWSIPGVAWDKKQQYRQQFGVKFIEGTGDAFVSQEHYRLAVKAGEYAKSYNLFVLNQTGGH